MRDGDEGGFFETPTDPEEAVFKGRGPLTSVQVEEWWGGHLCRSYVSRPGDWCQVDRGGVLAQTSDSCLHLDEVGVH